MASRSTMRRSPFSRRYALVLLLVTLPAAAAPSERDKQRASELTNSATQAFSAGDFARAAALVKQAYALDPAPVLLYNLARALEGSGDESGAIDAYKRYLDSAPDAPDRGAVEARIRTLESAVRERASLRAQAEQREPKQTTATQAPKTPALSPPTADSPPSRVGPLITIGAGAVTLAAGVAFGVLSNSQHATAKDPSTAGNDVDDHQDRARRFATISNVGFVAGAVLLAGGVTWFVLTPRGVKPESTTARVDLGAGSLRLVGRF